MKLITATQLANWADDEKSRNLLPKLVKKLIYASKHGVKEVVIPTDEQIQEPGWDGVVTSLSDDRDNETFIPNGTCLIEMGTNKNVRAKANDDYSKRCKDSLGYNPKECTYVFVTPRNWSRATTWERDKVKDGIWREVKVINATVLADWIEACPTVESWLSKEYGISINGLDLESFWDEWSTNSEGKKLDLSFAISGRDKVSQELCAKIAQHHDISVICKSTEEALAFSAASLLKYGTQEQINRTIISYNDNTTKELVKNFKDLIILHNGSKISNLNPYLQEKNISIVYLLPAVSKSIGAIPTNCIDLPDVDIPSFAQALSLTLDDEHLAYQYARDTGRNITILRRRLGFDGTMPQWSNSKDLIKLLPAFILGMWNEECEGDKKVLEKLTGQNYTIYKQFLNGILHEEDSPFVKVGAEWLLKSPYDVMSLAMPYICDSGLIEILKGICKAITDDVDTTLKDDWYKKTYHRFNLKYSYSIRRGILRTLILLSVFSDKEELVNDVNYTISQLTRPNVDWWLTACHSDILSLMAEAAPYNFLKVIENDLHSDNSIIRTIFKNDFAHKSLFGNSVHYISILQALEVTAWLPNCLPIASEILLSLCNLGAKEGHVNSPFTSLKEIFNILFPHTFATTNKRVSVLKNLFYKNQHIAFKLCSELIKGRQSGFSNYSPTLWRTFGKYQPIVPNSNEYYLLLSCCVELCCSVDNLSEAEYLSLLDILCDEQKPKIQDNEKKLIITTLNKKSPQLKGNQVILKRLHRIDYFDYVSSLKKKVQRSNWIKKLIETVTPEDLIGQVLWKFDHNYLEPSIYDKDYKNRGTKIYNNRKAAFNKILKNKGLSGIKELLERTDMPNVIGQLLAGQKVPSKYIEFVLKFSNNKSFTCAFFRMIYYKHPKIFNKIITSNTYDENTKCFILSSLAVIDSKIVKYLDSFSENFRKAFWNNIDSNIYVGKENLDYACSNFCHEERYDVAINLIDIGNYNDVSITTNTIVEALLGAFTHPNPMLENLNPYDLEKIIKDLDSRPDAEDKDVIDIELFFTAWRNEPIDKNSRLVKAVYSDPHFLFSMICCIYPPKHSNESCRNISLEEETLAIASRIIIENLKTLPFIDEKGNIDGYKLRKYVDNLYNLGIENDRKIGTAIEIGSLLGNTPINDDFPQDEICQILQDYNDEDMLNSFRVRLYNRRGAAFRQVYDGGDQKRDLVEKIDKFIIKTEDKYYYVANEVFQVLKDELRHDATRMDNHAELERLEF